MNELTKRVAVAAIGIPVAIGLFWLGGIWFFLAVVVISLGSLIEFINIAEKKEIHIDKKLLIGLSFIMQAIAYYLYSSSKLSLVFPVTGIFIMFSTLVLLTSKLFSAKCKSIESVFVGIGGMIYLPFMMLSLYFLREFNLFLLNAQVFDINLPMMNDFFGLLSSMQNHHWFWFVLLMFSGVWVCDSGAYFLGKAFGKHKLLERVSPKKTIEGAVGGFLCSAIWFSGLAAVLLPQIPIIDSILMGLIIGIVGQIGDLAESQLKRDAGVKDSSNLLPGHGGLLDRFDSIIFVAPSIFIYLVLRVLIY